ncbi:hypothetical protein ACHAP8_010038 [Fusarium lateritium]
MAQYSQVYNVDDHDSNVNTGRTVYHSTTNPHHPSDYVAYNPEKQAPFPAATELNPHTFNQHPMQQYAPANPQPRTIQRQPWQRRVGCLGWWIIGLGTVVMLAASAFLVFIWYGAALARWQLPRPKLWDSIVFDDNAARVVTLCSAAIRVAMDFQIGLLAASMAAIIIETTGTRLSDLVSLSLSRAFIESASPWDVFLIARHRTSRKAVSVNWVIPLLSFVVGSAMTFASTIMLSDFNMFQIAAPRTTRSIALGFDLKKAMADPAGTSFWQSKPQAHWRFAETRLNATENNSTLKHVYDTGDIYQASLPFDTMEDRASLQYYEGPAIVTNSRTVCVAPTFTNATIEYQYTGSELTEGLYLHAEVDTLASWDSGPRINGSQVAQITCRLNNYWDETSDSWPLSICSFPNLDTSAVNMSLKDPLSGRPYTFQSVLLLNASSILNLNIVIPYWTGSTENWATVAAIDDLQMDKFVMDGPWTAAFAANGSEILQATVCFTAPTMPLLYNVTMSGKAILSEPRSEAKLKEVKQKSANGTKYLEQLGIGGSASDLMARGILDLKVHSDPQSLATQDFEVVDAAIGRLIRMSLFDFQIAGGWAFNNDALMGYLASWLLWPANSEHSFLVQKILHDTGDPAIAVQALFSRFSQMIFHDMLPYWTRDQSIITVNVKRVLIPSQWTGLIIVLALIISHMVLMLVTVGWFLASTKLSILGNTWQAVSQIVSPETGAVLQTVSNSGMTDDEVQKWITTTAFDDHIHSLSTSVDNGGLNVRKR